MLSPKHMQFMILQLVVAVVIYIASLEKGRFIGKNLTAVYEGKNLTTVVDEGEDLTTVVDEDKNLTTVLAISTNDAAPPGTSSSSVSVASLDRCTTNNGTLDPFTQCMLNVEKELLTQEQINEWDAEIVPIPYSVKIIDNRFYIVTHLVLDFRSKFLKYTCNGMEGAEVEEDVYSRDMLIVRCPSALNAANMTLTEYTGINQTSNEIIFSQNVTLLAECERKDIDLFQKKDRIKLAASVSMYKSNTVQQALEWAAYHLAAGIDHVWVYVNRDWIEDLPIRHYITWVPWNFHMGTYSRERAYRSFKFQENSMNEALWRAKRLGIDWIATIDLDEYIVVNNGKALNLLPQYFHNRSDIGISNYTAIQMNSIPFGKDASEARNSKELLLDYEYRHNVSVDDFEMNRYKLFMNPKYAKGVNTHYLGGGPNKLYIDKASNFRMNHYRSPENGVFQLGGGSATHDPSLKNTFHDVVVVLSKNNSSSTI